MVRIRDRYLGFTHRGLMLAVVAYIIGFVFIINQGYVEVESSKGTASVLLDGGASAKYEGDDKFVDTVDASYPPTEPAAFFIATQLFLTPKQKMEEDCPMPML